MEVRLIRGDIRSCNNCGRKNYKSSLDPQGDTATVVQLYDLIVGNMCVALCSDCLAEISKITANPSRKVKCSNCRNIGFRGFTEAYCTVSSKPISNDSLDEEHECEHFDSRYIQYPINVTGIEKRFDTSTTCSLYPCGQPVLVRPCGKEYKDKTFFGILLGDLPIDAIISHNRVTGALNVTAHNNPAIFVPELKKIVYGCESWWERINSLEDVKSEITDSDIENCWYVKLMNELIADRKGADTDE